MPSIPLVALKGFAYHRRRLTKGDAFEALTAADAKVLRLAGMARDPDAGRLPEPSTREGPGPDARLPEPADLPTDDPHAIPSPKRLRGRQKKYETADLTPDDK